MPEGARKTCADEMPPRFSHAIDLRMIQRREPYRDAGADFFDQLQPEDTSGRGT
jgi:hypothetical protein